MRRNKIIDISFLLRTVVLTAMLCLSFHIGAFSHIAPDHSIHFVPAQNLLISTFLFVLVARTSVNSLVLQVWNKITPVKSKSTLIETEIVYILSVLLGIPLFAAIFLHTTISDLPILLSVLFFAALPGSFCAYIFQRINMKTSYIYQLTHRVMAFVGHLRLIWYKFIPRRIDLEELLQTQAHLSSFRLNLLES